MSEEFVTLVARGYEWKCPNCGLLNEEPEITMNVTCTSCLAVYYVNEDYLNLDF